MDDTLWLIVVLALGAFTQGAVGFGSGLVAVGLGPLFVPLADVVVAVAIVSPLLSVSVLRRHWRDLVGSDAGALLAGGVLGVGFGVSLLRDGNPHVLHPLVALSIAAALIGSRVRSAPVQGRLWPVMAGAAGGVLGGAVGTSGPPVALWTSLARLPRGRAVAAMQVFFLGVVAIELVAFARSGLLTTGRAHGALLALPGVILGLLIGQRVGQRLADATFRKALEALLAVVAVQHLVLALRA